MARAERPRVGRFALLAVLATTLGASVAGAEPGLGPATALPSPAGGAVVGVDPFSALSCASPGQCVAVGPLDARGAGSTATIDEVVDGVAETPFAPTLPGGALSSDEGSSEFLDVDCWGVGNCLAVGFDYLGVSVDGSDYPSTEPIADLEVDDVWSPVVQLSTPDGPASGELTRVSCDDTGDCVAGGAERLLGGPAVGASRAFVMTETSGDWAPAEDLPGPTPDPAVVELAGLSCTVAAACEAIEDVGVGTAPYSFAVDALTESSGRWAAPEPVAGRAGQPWLAAGLSCWTIGACVAVGAQASTNLDLVEHSGLVPAVSVATSGIWTSAHSLALPVLSPHTTAGELAAVDCAAERQCVAVGTAVIGPGATTTSIAATYSGSAWSSVGLLAGTTPAGTEPAADTGLTSISCPTGDCEALGLATTGTIVDPGPGYSVLVPVAPTSPVNAPGRPMGLSVTVSGTTAVARWAAPHSDGGEPITSFTVRAVGPRDRSCRTAALSCVITGLTARSTYDVTVVAHTIAASSTPDGPVAITTGH